MDISGLPSNYADYLSASSSATSKMNNISRAGNTGSTDEEMMDACKQFEQYLVEMVLDEVTDSMDLFGMGKSSSAAMSTGQDFLKDSMVQKLAEQVTDSANLGIAQQLYESMKRNGNTIDASSLPKE